MDTLMKLNNNVVKFLEKPMIKYGFLGLVVLQILLIDKLSTGYLEAFDMILTKVIIAFLVAYYACFDPIYAIALTTLLIVSIQELHGRRALLTAVSMKSVFAKSLPENPFITSEMEGGRMSEQVVKYDNLGDASKDYISQDENIFNEINKQSLQKVPSPGDKIVAEYDYYTDPAYTTLTANLANNQVLGRNKFYVTGNDLNVAQNNVVPNANQIESVQMVGGDMNNIQGLRLPVGCESKH
jgi:hypothetical protein